MTTKNKTHFGRSPRLLPRTSLLAASAAIVLTGCDSILDVTDPTVAAPSTIQTEAAVPTTLASAIGSFSHALSGSAGAGSFVDGQITLSGMLSDELYVGDSFPTRIDVGQRQTEFTNANAQSAYARLHTARRLAEQSAALHTRFDATSNTVGHAHALNLIGLSYILFGENYCSGVPFSAVEEDGSITYGAPQTTQQMFEQAVAYFDQAIAAATAAGTGAVEQVNLARVGKGRALLNLNRPADAAAAVAEVPTSFVYRATHSAGSVRQQNGVWVANHSARRVQASNNEGGNGLPYRADNDPRVRTAPGLGARALAFDQSTPHFDQLKYPSNTASVIVASGVEARLIEAEHQLRTGGNWLATLNALRASPPAYFPATPAAGQASFPDIATLAPLADPGAEAGRVDLLFKERAYWMWLTSHRLGDQRRLMRQYGRTQAGAGFPTGPFYKGGQYGNHVSLLVPFDALNNPLFREQFPQGCDPTIP
jgi:starch-binding outer membrane protein, SusD/RagB family